MHGLENDQTFSRLSRQTSIAQQPYEKAPPVERGPAVLKPFCSCRTPAATAKPSAMSLQNYVNKKVLVLTSDSRTLVGMLLSCDQMTNLVLSQTTERIIRPPDDPEPSSEVPHGLYLIRGDNVVVVGLVDEELDDSINWLAVRGAVVGGVKHS
ncbi:hypothetical protein BGZ57DRAFT_884469 [Hyaloscypha finlandica]|nr:hypothetical protein BGZ57DRAFT_884469 [Hyaloscypha finlandica]